MKQWMARKRAACSVSRPDLQALPQDTLTGKKKKEKNPTGYSPNPDVPIHSAPHQNMHSDNTNHLLPQQEKDLNLCFKYQINYPSHF